MHANALLILTGRLFIAIYIQRYIAKAPNQSEAK